MGMILGDRDWEDRHPGLDDDGTVYDDNGVEVTALDDDYEYWKHYGDDDDFCAAMGMHDD